MSHNGVLVCTVERIGHGLQSHWKAIAASLAVAGVAVLRMCLRRKIVCEPVDYQDGIVYIHMFPRCFTKKVVNLSPFAIKVETWCRVNKIPHKVVQTNKFSPKERQIPWIRYNGQIMADSTVIIEFLANEFNISDGLTDEQQGVSRAVCRMLDENFSVLYFLYRYSMKTDEFAKYFRITTAPRLLQRYIVSRIGNSMIQRAQLGGFGRYGENHVMNLGKKDLKALDSILGDKQYMMGDSATMVDATAFGHLSQILYPDLSYPWKAYIHTDCPRLADYCDRIKDTYWPDWDSLVEHDTFH